MPGFERIGVARRALSAAPTIRRCCEPSSPPRASAGADASRETLHFERHGGRGRRLRLAAGRRAHAASRVRDLPALLHARSTQRDRGRPRRRGRRRARQRLARPDAKPAARRAAGRRARDLRQPQAVLDGAGRGRGFGGAFFIGYHGGAGDADAVLCHTYTPSVIYEVRVNGVRCSEATINAGLLGYYGVPLLLVTGDRTTVEGVRAQMPWVRGVIVKESIGNFAADSMTPPRPRAARSAAAPKPPSPRPARPALPLRAADRARRATRDGRAGHLVATIPGFERTGSRSVRFAHDAFRWSSKRSSRPGASAPRRDPVEVARVCRSAGVLCGVPASECRHPPSQGICLSDRRCSDRR